MLKQTGCKIDLISDYEMSDLLRKNIRGGLSFINTRSAGVGSLHEEEEKERGYNYVIKMLDANNLYGLAMTMPLPLRDFRWMSEEEIEEFDPIKDVQDGDGRGFIVECDLEYPAHLHLPHSSFPLAPETVEISTEMLSPYSKECFSTIYNKQKHKAKKLTATFHTRRNYVVHGMNLKYYLSKGLRLKKVHRVITFYQSAFIASFINYCTRKRREAKTETEKQLWKLIVNSLYGKLIEGVANRMDCR